MTSFDRLKTRTYYLERQVERLQDSIPQPIDRSASLGWVAWALWIIGSLWNEHETRRLLGLKHHEPVPRDCVSKIPDPYFEITEENLQRTADMFIEKGMEIDFEDRIFHVDDTSRERLLEQGFPSVWLQEDNDD